MKSKLNKKGNSDIYFSKYEGREIEWKAKISAYYSQITGIKFCIIDSNHLNIDIDKPGDVFWAFSCKLISADNSSINPN